jgi:transcriptional regulator with XRE-family HTH domain
MPSKLGRAIKDRRSKLGMGLRELAGRIGKSPSFLSTLENADDPPAVAEDTLRSIEDTLELEPYVLVTLAGRTPEEVTPDDPLEVELYRQIKRRSRAEKEKLLRQFRKDKPDK